MFAKARRIAMTQRGSRGILHRERR